MSKKKLALDWSIKANIGDFKPTLYRSINSRYICLRTTSFKCKHDSIE